MFLDKDVRVGCLIRCGGVVTKNQEMAKENKKIRKKEREIRKLFELSDK